MPLLYLVRGSSRRIFSATFQCHYCTQAEGILGTNYQHHRDLVTQEDNIYSFITFASHLPSIIEFKDFQSRVLSRHWAA